MSDAHSVQLQPAYVLHARPYRDTSIIVDLLTQDHGRITAVARGVRSSKGHKRQLLAPFHRLLVNWQGKSSLKLLTGFETEHHFLQLMGNYLYSGFYLNELLVRLIPEQDVQRDLFARYEATLYAFHLQRDLEPMLREFERALLDALGYGIDYAADCLTHQAINSALNYCINPQLGFFVAPEGAHPSVQFSGSLLAALAARDYSEPQVRTLAKKINRLLLRPLLGRKPLKSRELFAPRD